MAIATIYEVAVDLAEARDLWAHHYGYETREAAEKALASPDIDSFYRGRLKIFKLTVEEGDVCA